MRLRTPGVACALCAVAASVPPPAVAGSAERGKAKASSSSSSRLDRGRGPRRVLVDRNMFLSRRLARLRDDRMTLAERRDRRAALRDHTMPELRRSTTRVIRKIHRERSGDLPPQLKAIARCESGGDPRAISAGGRYRGKYQFSYSTWRSVGGTGDPARASEAEQDRRAAKLYRTGGPGHWPVCGR